MLIRSRRFFDDFYYVISVPFGNNRVRLFSFHDNFHIVRIASSTLIFVDSTILDEVFVKLK